MMVFFVTMAFLAVCFGASSYEAIHKTGVVYNVGDSGPV